MRNSLASFVLALGLLAGAVADAAVLPVQGTLSIAISRLETPVVFTGSGVGSSAGGIGSAATIPAALFDATQPVSAAITPIALGISLIHVEASPTMPVQNAALAIGPGTFANGGNLGGFGGLQGTAQLWFGFDMTGTPPVHCPSGGVLPTDPGCFAGTVPLAYFGGGGTGMGAVAGLPATFVGAAWSNLGANETTPTRVVKLQQTFGGNQFILTATAFDKRTTGGAGSIQLVAPVSVKLFGGSLGTLPAVGVLTLQFVPEPGTLLLVGSGIVGVAVAGRTRTRS